MQLDEILKIFFEYIYCKPLFYYKFMMINFFNTYAFLCNYFNNNKKFKLNSN